MSYFILAYGHGNIKRGSHPLPLPLLLERPSTHNRNTYSCEQGFICTCHSNVLANAVSLNSHVRVCETTLLSGLGLAGKMILQSQAPADPNMLLTNVPRMIGMLHGVSCIPDIFGCYNRGCQYYVTSLSIVVS